MPKGDLVRKHIEYYQSALDALQITHAMNTTNATEPHHAEVFNCDCEWGRSWKWLRRQQLEAERKVYLVR